MFKVLHKICKEKQKNFIKDINRFVSSLRMRRLKFSVVIRIFRRKYFNYFLHFIRSFDGNIFKNKSTLIKKTLIKYKDSILPHKFYADFVVFNKVIVEVKAKQGGIAEEDLAQTINYLRCSACKVGLILNFGKMKLEIKRVVF